MTLKAGSKVYVPNRFEANGTTPKFDVVTIDNDIQAVGPLESFTDKWVFGYRNNSFYWEILSHCFSGSTLPTQTGENRLGYNTTLNKFQGSVNGGAYIDDICSFPICIFSTTSGAITSIDQVFNGFVYIGSHFFVLPGVKVQIPNGRNEDGSYKTFSVTTNSVTTVSHPNTVLGGMNWYINHLGNAYYYGSNYIKFSENNLWESTEGQGNIIKGVVVATSDVTSGVISNYKSCIVDSVANSNLSNLSPAGEAKLKSNIQLVNELPTNYVAGVLYCIPEA